ncbi:MAG: membrane protein insertion efficiency factor YidD [Clostridia bacterium]|nr:membrane protein insertion efficiency factor YidD [Clostridia bacterium]
MLIINNVFRVLLYPVELLVICLIYLYKWLLSPMFGNYCAYMPTCSTYVLRSIQSFGLIYGGYLGTKRVLNCNPKSCGGYDFVKLNIQGDYKWVC